MDQKINVSKSKEARRPVIDPILLALKSRRVLIALSTLIVGMLILAVPGLEAVEGELLTLVLTLALALIGGYTIEDAAIAAKGRGEQPIPDDLRALMRVTLLTLLSEDVLEEKETIP